MTNMTEKKDKHPCEVCGKPNAEEHHEDYLNNITVWLCSNHHMRRQRDLRRLGKDLNRVLKPGRVAKIFGVKERTVARWCRDGQLQAVKMGRVWRIPASEVLRAMKEGLRVK